MKKRDQSREPESAPKGPEFGNSKLKDALGAWKKAVAPTAAPPPVKQLPEGKPPPGRQVRAQKPLPPPPGRPKSQFVRPEVVERNDVEGDALFRMVMEDVAPIPKKKQIVEAIPDAPLPRLLDEEGEALAQLAELVATGEGFDVADTDEYIEGIGQGIDTSLVVRLRRGDFSVQAHLDLHGHLVDAAKLALENFLAESRRQGRRCVLVIHGRGLHSKDQEPVLKSRIGTWLSKGKTGRMVLAFATARPVDGGAGAVYVLLRR